MVRVFVVGGFFGFDFIFFFLDEGGGFVLIFSVDTSSVSSGEEWECFSLTVLKGDH